MIYPDGWRTLDEPAPAPGTLMNVATYLDGEWYVDVVKARVGDFAPDGSGSDGVGFELWRPGPPFPAVTVADFLAAREGNSR